MTIPKESILILVWLLSVTGCEKSDQLTKSQTVKGVTVELTAMTAGSDAADPGQIMSDALKEFESRLSIVYGKGCELDMLNQAHKPIEVSIDLYNFLELIAGMEEETRGRWNPRLGSLYDLWGFNDGNPHVPDADLVESTWQRCMESRLKLSDNNIVELTNHASLQVDREGIGWAVDGAAEILIKGGINTGKVSADGIYRVWGAPANQPRWSIIAGDPTEEKQGYKIEPDDGGLCVIEFEQVKVELGDRTFAAILKPALGLPAETCRGVAVWSMTALSATVFAEYAFTLDRDDVFERFSEMEPVSLFYSYEGEFGLMVETDPRMAKWLSAILK